MAAEKYRIVLMFANDTPSKVVKRGLTLEEAQEHCRREDTHGTLKNGTRWFDGYEASATPRTRSSQGVALPRRTR